MIEIREDIIENADTVMNQIVQEEIPLTEREVGIDVRDR